MAVSPLYRTMNIRNVVVDRHIFVALRMLARKAQSGNSTSSGNGKITSRCFVFTTAALERLTPALTLAIPDG